MRVAHEYARMASDRTRQVASYTLGELRWLRRHMPEMAREIDVVEQAVRRVVGMRGLGIKTPPAPRDGRRNGRAVA